MERQIRELHDQRNAAEDRAQAAELLLMRVALRLDLVGPSVAASDVNEVARRVSEWTNLVQSSGADICI